jgi:U4/U6 small nuclear ribonucleoprotein PRP3
MSQHKAIDLTGTGQAATRIKRKLTPEDRRSQIASNRAIESLLANRLIKAQKTENDNKTASSSSGIRTHTPVDVPDVEWWDKAVYDDPSLITHLIEHPIPIKGFLKDTDTAEQKVMLTEEERRKLRKLRNQEKLREFQDKIKMGLIPPPPPKIKMKNLMLVLGNEQVAEPSAIEQSVRSQIQQRLEDHLRRNEEKKLSPEARRQKTISKWTNSTDSHMYVSVFIVPSKAVTGKIKFKINKSGEELHLGGFFLDIGIESIPSLIVAMGSRKSIKRFDKTLLKRIDWVSGGVVADDDNDDEEEDKEQKEDGGGICHRIFHGSQPHETKLPRWSYLVVKDMETARSFVTDKKCSHFFDMALRFRDDKLDV